MGVANFFCLWIALKVFDVQPHLALDWVQSCSLSMVIAWGVLDPLVILLRKCSEFVSRPGCAPPRVARNV